MKRLLLAAAAALTLGAAPALAQGKSVKIGFVSTFSGPTAVIGNDMRNVFELAERRDAWGIPTCGGGSHKLEANDTMLRQLGPGRKP